MEVAASLSQGRTAAAQCGLFTYKSVPVIFEPPCILHWSSAKLRLFSVIMKDRNYKANLAVPEVISGKTLPAL